ncbi:MAG: Subtilisin E [Planctomycetes bacterium]|nr:Subtilisin E [Planctomycetota bacterium]
MSMSTRGFSVVAGVVLLAAGSFEGMQSGASGAGLDRPVIDPDFAFEDVGGQFALALMHRSGAATVATGDGVKVAVLDGGFDLSHEYLDGRLGAQWDAYAEDAFAEDIGNDVDDDGSDGADDFVGHGTFVAGLILAAAPDAEILPIRVLDDEGNGGIPALVRGIDKAVELGADVINLSMVVPSMSGALEEAIDDAIAAGVTIVCAAGNSASGPFSDSYLRDRSIVVSACTDSLTIPAWAPNLSLVEVFAPGVGIVGPVGGDTADSYGTWDGTSFSCAFVAAAAALVLEDAPDTTPSAMTSLLMESVDAVDGAEPRSRGCIDMEDAVQ